MRGWEYGKGRERRKRGGEREGERERERERERRGLVRKGKRGCQTDAVAFEEAISLLTFLFLSFSSEIY